MATKNEFLTPDTCHAMYANMPTGTVGGSAGDTRACRDFHANLAAALNARRQPGVAEVCVVARARVRGSRVRVSGIASGARVATGARIAATAGVAAGAQNQAVDVERHFG